MTHGWESGFPQRVDIRNTGLTELDVADCDIEFLSAQMPAMLWELDSARFLEHLFVLICSFLWHAIKNLFLFR